MNFVSYLSDRDQKLDWPPTIQDLRAYEWIWKKIRGAARRRRDRAISDKLHEVHTPWHQRQTEKSL
jgi:hypothetical protein